MLPVVPSWSQQSAEPPSQPSMDESCRIAQGGSKDKFPSSAVASGGQLSLSGLPQKETAANPSAAGTAVAATALLAESWDSGRAGEL